MDIDATGRETVVVQGLKDQCTKFETLLQQAETRYIRQGLQFHCMTPSSDWPLGQVRQVRAVFTVTDDYSLEAASGNKFVTRLEHLHRQLGIAKGYLEAENLQNLQDLLDKAAAEFTAFNTDLSNIDSIAKELAALSGLRDLSVDNKAKPENEPHELVFVPTKPSGRG
ncbi:hypothetical protein M409DRAFT_56550 [Zasmidium cellare ATCC 36951]|uniref:Uncharacterized protein n=1 Tax=Zasmidium cellare ATCC 36951 TaxID=1080233 RepID=A0A6A6CET0_ZASCE|nr:uncharacterized protein M409DRAFT_56550 [Zasmidium cellare ATCC 36951]KAF2164750.1 hypothetical protein M409DRAFT_56550 [Zasmidium cellare ATCC 36951]